MNTTERPFYENNNNQNIKEKNKNILTLKKVTKNVTNLHECQEKIHICVFIGRFSPFHKGHEHIIQTALSVSDYTFVLVGSAYESRTVRNPFTVEERMHMISSTVKSSKMCVLPLEDSEYNLNDWITRVYQTVHTQMKILNIRDSDVRISLIGHSKDQTSFYLNLFPEWESISVESYQTLSATQIRECLFGSEKEVLPLLEKSESHQFNGYVEDYVSYMEKSQKNFLTKTTDVSDEVKTFLTTFVQTEDCQLLMKETAFLQKYKYAWRKAPYKPIFVTADMVIIQSGYVLLQKRKGYPGYGLWALPGGFVEQNETVLEAGLRELHEEVGLKVPVPVLRGNIIRTDVFDDPFRSSRGRTITHATLIHLPPGKLPKYKGVHSNDMETAKIAWVKLSELKREKCFEDHYAIIKKMSKLI